MLDNKNKKRSRDRIPRILNKIFVVWNDIPDLRFFQLMDFLASISSEDKFYFEDDEFEKLLDEVIHKKDLGELGEFLNDEKK